MFKKVVLLAALCCALPVSADVAVIVHPSSSVSVDAQELERLYTGKSSALTAVNLVESQPIRAEFDEKGVGRSSAQLKAFWSKLVFTGKGTPPAELADEAAILRHVAETPNAIGYVDASKVNSSVKVVLTLP